jgi:hypothetical protein
MSDDETNVQPRSQKTSCREEGLINSETEIVEIGYGRGRSHSGDLELSGLKLAKISYNKSRNDLP